MTVPTWPFVLTGWCLPGLVFAAESPQGVISIDRLLEFGLALILVVALIYGVAWLVGRMQHSVQGQGTVKVIQGMQVGAKERLLLVDVAGQTILVGVSPGGMQTLLEVHESLAPEVETGQLPEVLR